MARYYEVEADLRFVALDLSEQLRPGTFEHALSYLIDHELDLSHFDTRYRNDDTGAPAYPPAMLLKIVLFGYSQACSAAAASPAPVPAMRPSSH